MVRLPEGYCIDSTEVTRAQYAAWLATKPSTKNQLLDCSGNSTFTPGGGCMIKKTVCQTDCDNHPQVCVDWCDANAYCRAVGKRLCGNIGGGPTPYDEQANAGVSQWYNACTSHAINSYPYGTSYAGQACNGSDYPMTLHTTLPVGNLATCQSSVSGYGGVFDLSGNVGEWEDSTLTDAGQLYGRIRGGAFAYSEAYQACAYAASGAIYSSFADAAVGFRCCS